MVFVLSFLLCQASREGRKVEIHALKVLAVNSEQISCSASSGCELSRLHLPDLFYDMSPCVSLTLVHLKFQLRSPEYLP